MLPNFPTHDSGYPYFDVIPPVLDYRIRSVSGEISWIEAVVGQVAH